jgi:hypothetical protein
MAGLPLGVLIGLGALLLVGGVLLGGIVAVAIMRSPARQAATATVTSLPLPTQVAVVIPTTTPAPTSTDTPPPTASKTPVPPTATPTGVITPTEAAAENVLTADVGANIRSGPGIVFPVIASLKQGEQASVLGKDVSGTWFVIHVASAPKGQGWIAGLVTTYEGDLASLPVIKGPPPPAASPTPRANTVSPSTGGGPVTGSHGLSGKLTLCSAKTAYAVGERVCFVEWIQNSTGAPISYGILGVQATNLAGGGQFQTSWSADLAPGGVLWIDPGCIGPTDRCNGQWEDGMRLSTSGNYRLTLNVCFSDFGACLGNDGQWEGLSVPIIISVN